MGMKGDTENMKHVWQIFLFLTVLVSCLTGCGRRQAMEIEEETFLAVSSFEEESQEETEVSRGTLFVDVRGAVAKPGRLRTSGKKSGFSGGGSGRRPSP